MDVIIPTNLVCTLFGPAIPTSIVFYACGTFKNSVVLSSCQQQTLNLSSVRPPQPFNCRDCLISEVTLKILTEMSFH